MPVVEERCTRCGKVCSRENLHVKTIVFRKMGYSAISRQRVTDHLCPECVSQDEDWNKPGYSGPSHRSSAKDRAKAVRDQTLDRIFGGEIT